MECKGCKKEIPGILRNNGKSRGQYCGEVCRTKYFMNRHENYINSVPGLYVNVLYNKAEVGSTPLRVVRLKRKGVTPLKKKVTTIYRQMTASGNIAVNSSQFDFKCKEGDIIEVRVRLKKGGK